MVIQLYTMTCVVALTSCTIVIRPRCCLLPVISAAVSQSELAGILVQVVCIFSLSWRKCFEDGVRRVHLFQKRPVLP